ncbi:HAMP domain-containing sensor histidine kinase [Cytobacillus praedii]|uniref:sensor histidine kinase n=1 Tax=Cytobacillus praedii TaxID=1742358 RepID=UPI002E218B3D|nr:HAMP domain-containing sensor histidine kinase [Cytobacillus praedii]
MSIKTRFLLSYIGVIIISIALLLAATFLIIFSITGDLKSIEHFYKNTYVQKPLTAEEENAFLDLKLLAKHSPEKLLDQGAIEQINQKGISIVVRKDSKITYISPSYRGNNLQHELPPFEETNINTRDTIKVGSLFYTYVKFDFRFSDNEKGSIFVLRKVSSYAELSKELFPILLGSLLLLFIMMIGILNYLVSRSIIKPISVLRKGAERIKSGDLNFQIAAASKNEIGQLNQAFEEMRIKLKESVDLQIQYEENRKELLSNISHDLKTPITSIIGYVEGIKDGVANTPEKMNKYLNTVYTKAKDLDLLIDELFLFSKLDLQKEQFSFEKVELVQYLKDFVEELSLDLVQQGILLELSPALKPVYIIADREKLKRVMSNLINNSIKNMNKDEKRICISLHERSNDLIIQVIDNGSGIKPEALPFIFNRFYRAEQSRNSQTGGSGLGLAIVKKIIIEHGGEVWAASELNKGTSIFFTLNKVIEIGDEK